jgi:hypothetical protein
VRVVILRAEGVLRCIRGCVRMPGAGHFRGQRLLRGRRNRSRREL